jgi:hypothetical protein
MEMTNALVKSALKKKSTLSPKPPLGRKQTETMGGMRSMDPNAGDMEVRAREDTRTLHEAMKIRADKDRMGAVKDHVMSLGQALSGDVKVSDKKMGRK